MYKQADSAYLLEVLLAGILISWPNIRAVGACPMRVLEGYTGGRHAIGRQTMGGQGPRTVGLLLPGPHPGSHRSMCSLQNTVAFMFNKQNSAYIDASCKQQKQIVADMTMICQSCSVGYMSVLSNHAWLRSWMLPNMYVSDLMA